MSIKAWLVSTYAIVRSNKKFCVFGTLQHISGTKIKHSLVNFLCEERRQAARFYYTNPPPPNGRGTILRYLAFPNSGLVGLIMHPPSLSKSVQLVHAVAAEM